jgi:hypothetical protein
MSLPQREAHLLDFEPKLGRLTKKDAALKLNRLFSFKDIDDYPTFR